MGKPTEDQMEVGFEMPIDLIGIDLDGEGWVMRYYPEKRDDKLFLYLSGQ